jgi:hypothetical protein
MGMNRATAMALLAALGGCAGAALTGAASHIGPPLVRLLAQIGAVPTAYPPVILQMPPVPAVFTLALGAFAIGALFGASLPWIFSAKLRSPFPLITAAGALVGAAAGYFLEPYFARFVLGRVPAAVTAARFYWLAWYAPIFLSAAIGARLASVIEWPMPQNGFVRFLIALALWGSAAFSLKMLEIPAFPTGTAASERDAWAQLYFGQDYLQVVQAVVRSGEIKKRLGEPLTVAPEALVGGLRIQPEGVFFETELTVSGPRGRGAIHARVRRTLLAAAPSDYEIAWSSGTQTLFLTLDGSLDLRRMSAAGAVVDDLRDRLLKLYRQKKYAALTRAYEARHAPASASQDPLITPEIQLVLGKAYEFQRRPKDAARYYAAAATLLRFGLTPDVTRAERLARKALTLDPDNPAAQRLLPPSAQR